MSNQSTPKTVAFRSLVQKIGTLHSEITTLDTAIRERDAIRASMADCENEMEARKHLGDLNRAEETVIIKQARLPRQQAELADFLTQAEEAFHEANSELTRINDEAPKQSMEAFHNLLVSAQLDPEDRKVEQANTIVVKAIRPRALVDEQENRLHEARRSVTWSEQPVERRVAGFIGALEWLDKFLAAQIEVIAEDKRMVAACQAFLKVLAKG